MVLKPRFWRLEAHPTLGPVYRPLGAAEAFAELLARLVARAGF